MGKSVIVKVVCLFLFGLVVACDQGPTPIDENPVAGDDDFVSTDPSTWMEDEFSSSADGDADADGDGDADDGSAEREIEEADIIKVVDDRLYALSEYRGLVIIDVSDPDDLAVLGRYPTYGRPFEMYVRDGIAYPIYSSFWSFQYDEETGMSSWVSSSRIMALDVTNPESIRVQGTFDLGGEISDSRIVGEVLYAVAFEDGWCWRCDESPRTTITSLNLSDPTNIFLVDRLSYESDGSSYYRRSISVTQERMYVGGREWDSDSSTIQVVDISDPSGQIRAGAEVEVAGQIESRWQMNEHDGVLRVVSQAQRWDEPPVVETFAVESADSVTPLGRLEMELPRPESLMSVRFDGDRGYAVTFERTDPLFVIDLSDPADPVQRGELEIPGWLYHMEPRGDRLFAIGFDDEGDRSLAVSLFDVSDMDAPTMIDRVHFGAQWGWMVEDQDRIHKAFRILTDLGMIVMPFAGWSYDEEEGGGAWGEYHSGIQLIDFTEDDLHLRGVVPHHGFARRAFVHRDRLFAMSDERVEAFDISDRDTPERTSGILLARSVYRVTPVGDHIAELVSDWWTGEARLDLLPIDSPDGMTATGTLDLTPLRPDGVGRYSYWNNGFSYTRSRLFSVEDHVVLMWDDRSCYSTYYDDCDDGPQTGVAVIDVSDPAAPELVALEQLSFRFPYQAGWWWNGMVEAGETIVQLGSTIVLRNTGRYSYWDEEELASSLEIVDLSDPSSPVHADSFELPGGHEMSTLQVVDGQIVTSHREPVEDSSTRVRFYMDTIDLSDPASPELVRSVNIPGSVVWHDPDSGRLVTVDYQRVSFPAEDWDACYYDSPYSDTWYDGETGECRALERTLNLLAVDGRSATLLDRLDFSEREIRDVRVTPTRIFVGTSTRYWYWDDNDVDPRPELITLTGIDSGTFAERSSVRMSSPYSWLYAARDEQAIVLSDTPPALDLLDASDADDPEWTDQRLLTGYGYDVHVLDSRVVTANATWGVQVIEL